MPAAAAMCVLLTVSPGIVGAEVPVPPDLNPGDKYHLVFTTSRSTIAFSDPRQLADFVAQLVNSAGLGGVQWKTIISTRTTDARDWARVGANTPVYNMRLQLVASGFNDFWDGSHQAVLGVNERGYSTAYYPYSYSRTYPDAWTGSHPDGTRATGQTIGSDMIRIGKSGATDERWISGGTISQAGNGRWYVLSEELTVGDEQQEVPVLIAINAGLTDAWYDPQTSGQGFFITVLPEVESIFLAWFTFDTERPSATVTAELGDPGHRWLTAIGDYSGGAAVLDVELTSGGIFGAAQPAPVQTSSYGTITLEFAGCNELELTYDLPSVARTGVIDLQRISDDKVALCQELTSP